MTVQTPQNMCMSLCDWPAPDRDAWCKAIQPADLLDDSVGYATRWKLSTQRQIVRGYGRWLAWRLRAKPLDAGLDAGARATKPDVVAYRDELRANGLADYSVAGLLQELCNALRAIAPEQDWSWIQRASSRIHGRAVKKKNIDTLAQNLEPVIRLADDLMHAAEHDRFRTPYERAVMFRDGLIMAFLARRPLRKANLTALTLGNHLTRAQGGWALEVPPEETKTGQRIAFDWPPSLVEALERYLTVHRNVLLDDSHKCGPSRPTDALWISRNGTPMTATSIAQQVAHRTLDELGEAISLHGFRHMAATAIATGKPDDASTIQMVLSHTSLATSEKYYNRATRAAAGVAVQATIDALRKRRAGPRRRAYSIGEGSV